MHHSFSRFSVEVSVCLLNHSQHKPAEHSLTIIVYIFVGSIILSDVWYRYVSGVVIGGIGVAYCVLEFVPSIEPPANMREADGGWGAEQV